LQLKNEQGVTLHERHAVIIILIFTLKKKYPKENPSLLTSKLFVMRKTVEESRERWEKGRRSQPYFFPPIQEK
jgi:hypothetical protein